MQVLGNIKLWVDDVAEVEPAAVEQLQNIAGLPILGGHVAVMPDVHLGKGATVGSVVPTLHAIIPAAVGVDIGCGMCAVRTNLTANSLPDSLLDLRLAIEAKLPVGFASRTEGYHFRADDLQAQWTDLRSRMRGLTARIDHKKVGVQMGTMGGGNHFMELCIDEAGDVWVMLHSGSRNAGKTIAEQHISKARDLLAGRGFEVPDQDLAWLAEGEPEYLSYLHDLQWAQDYACLNRAGMLETVWAVLADVFPGIQSTGSVVNCHHNYVEQNYRPGIHLTRKGAVSAKAGEWGIIPGSMGTRSYIVQGKGNQDAYESCSHGAGRRMSRNEAAGKRDFKTGVIKAPGRFTVDDLIAQTAGVECRKDIGVLDETPGAYKDIDRVIAQQADLVEVRHTLKQVLCVKG